MVVIETGKWLLGFEVVGMGYYRRTAQENLGENRTVLYDTWLYAFVKTHRSDFIDREF